MNRTSESERERGYCICPEDIETTTVDTGAIEEDMDAGGAAHPYGDG
jgi:hypothetical protein